LSFDSFLRPNLLVTRPTSVGPIIRIDGQMRKMRRKMKEATKSDGRMVVNSMMILLKTG
jgi:hypothetical protein